MENSPLFSAFPDGDNLFEWIATIKGSAGTVYEGCSYKLRMKFPPEYPYSPPTVTFSTPCWHPNVDSAGTICLDILQDKWTAAYSVRTLLMSIQTLLADPNNASPLNTQAAQTWDDQVAYREMVRQKYKESTGSFPAAQ